MVDHAPRYRPYDSDVPPYDETPASHSVAPYQVGPSVRNYREQSVPLFLSDRDGVPDPSEYMPSLSRKHGVYYASRILAGAFGGVVIATVAALVSTSDSAREFVASAKASSVAALSAASVVMQPNSASSSMPSIRFKESAQAPAAETPGPASLGSANSGPASPASATVGPATVAVAAVTPTRDDIKTAYQSAVQGSAPPTEAAPEIAPPQETIRHLDAGEIAALLKRAEVLMASGDLAAARLVLRRAAEAGDAHAAMLLGGTYDPLVLEKQGVHGVVPDPAMARGWYEKAKRFGATEATAQLDLLAKKQN
jgi:hypothetical protein